VGFAAVLVLPGLKGAATNMALLKISVASFPGWMVGIIGATGVLTALVPGSLIMMTAATLCARNLVALVRPGQGDEQTALIAKCLVPVIGIVAVYFAISENATIVALLLMGYAFVTQLFPALIASLLPRNPVTKEGAACGILAGVVAVVYFTMANTTLAALLPGAPEVLRDLNIGTVALLVNIVAMAVVSAATIGRRAALGGEAAP